MSPSITILTATFNAEGHLARMLASLRAQTDRDFQSIVIDGGSTDGTLGILSSSGDVVTTVISERDRGIYDALNKGLRLVQTEFYLVVGADDILYPDAIYNYKSAIQHHVADVVVAGVRAGATVRSGYRPDKAWLGHAAMVTSHSVGMAFRTRLHDSFGEYSMAYSLLADGYFIKKVCKAPSVRTVAASFVAGEFGLEGKSNLDLVRSLCETWLVQRSTGENTFVQFLIFQARLCRHIWSVVR